MVASAVETLNKPLMSVNMNSPRSLAIQAAPSKLKRMNSLGI